MMEAKRIYGEEAAVAWRACPRRVLLLSGGCEKEMPKSTN